VIVASTANAMGLVQEVLAIAQGGFSILIDRHNDSLDVMVAISFTYRSVAYLSQRFNPRRIIGVWSCHLSSFTTDVPLGLCL
jgi:hypothetical protein